MKYTTIIETGELFQNLNNPDWVLMDCRYDLGNPDWAQAAYQQAHIPGAQYADLKHDLAAPVTPTSGRHPLPDPAAFIQRLSAWGIDAGKQVVVYDAAAGSFAARLWYMLNWLGHDAVAVLNGGMPKWERENRPLQSGIVPPHPGVFQGQPQSGFFLNTQELLQLRSEPNFLLIDARSPERYRGEQEPIDAVAGHIPGARNYFHGKNIAADGTLLPVDQLRQNFQSLLENTPPEQSIFYCGSGVTSCFNILAMRHAGLKGGRIYAGSWSEWIRDPNRPIQTGGQP